MKIRWISALIVGTLALALGVPSQQARSVQQGDCAVLARNVMNAVQSVCSGVKRDQVCYGNVSIEAALFNGGPDLQFSQQGDLADLQDVSSLRLKTLDINSAEWGVALMKVKASLPDDSAENVKVLLFGNVEIDNGGSSLVNLTMETVRSADVRLRPAADGPVAGSLDAGTTVIANGRVTNDAGEDWIRVQFQAAPGGFGWVLAAGLTTARDVSTLVPVATTGDNLYGPMQAFTFRGKAEDAPCEEAPNSGITIQTPKGKGQISLLINEVNLQIGSTVYIETTPGDDLQINTLEGHALVSSGGQTRLLPPGTQLTVPLDENGLADGAPTEPIPYDMENMLRLGVALDAGLFDREVVIPDAMDVDYLDDFNYFFNYEDSVFYDGQGDDHLFLEFFDTLFDENALSGQGSFADDISQALVDYLQTDALPADARTEFEQIAFQELDADSQAEFLQQVEQTGDSTLNEEVQESQQESLTTPPSQETTPREAPHQEAPSQETAPQEAPAGDDPDGGG